MTERIRKLEPLQAILFDLDGTLLDVDMDVLLPPYFELLASTLADILPPERFLPCLMKATRMMVANNGRDTNQEVFAQTFYPCIDASRQVLEPVFEAFYLERFPQLKTYTRPVPQAPLVLQAALDQGLAIVIATNPLFPAIAIQQRIKWAGIAGFDFRLVTSYENSRATKPNLQYYRDILTTLDLPAEACLMVGDEDMDMVAGRLGCPTFLIPGPRTHLETDTPPPTFQGSLADLLTLLESRL